MPVRTATKTRPKKAKTKAPVATASRAARPTRKSQLKDIEKFRARLIEERQRLEVELQEIEDRTARIAESDRASELGSWEDHPADLASETFEREKDLAIGESVESLLNQVLTALEKLDRGTYGVCDACDKPIKKARLNALPFATLCLACQDRTEH